MYDFPKLFKLLKEEYTPLPYLADDVYHLKLTKSDDLESPDCFIFSNGTFVSWGASESQIAHLLALVKNVEMNSYAIETEWFDFYVDQNQPGGMSTDTIVLGSDLSIEQAKFVYSAGITRSVKLGSLENLLEVHLTKNKHIPKTLLLGKHLGISRDQMLRNLGELFQLRAMVNLNSDLLDLPDFCWSSSQMELYFEMISKNLDVRPRIAVFNKKLDYANEIADMIRNHLHEQHSLKLEWAIIILISVEILFSVLHYLETGQF
ncbi:hypothetical protein BC833DRAFT_589253 [Globomyces pollinis-pini]|nr:hypothetical protein BC833DRAFT_589253 [Globomyces pollinis-pini]